MSKREFLMLAETYRSNKSVGGWYLSEKLDGIRCFWDGGLTKGQQLEYIPWANKEEGISTGLWTRHGNVIHAPEDWIKALPQGICLDGELWTGPKQFQLISSIVRRHKPDHRWESVRFRVFDSPSMKRVCLQGQIRGPQFEKYIDGSKCEAFLKENNYRDLTFTRDFEMVQEFLQHEIRGSGVVDLVHQEQLPLTGYQSLLTDKLLDVVKEGGEGLMLRAPRSFWAPYRSAQLLKVKKFEDAEGVIVSVNPGQGRLNGLMGSLTLRWNGKQFDLGGGFTDQERELSNWVPGQFVTFKYRELSNDGIPKEARFFRNA